jgi:hypothetical protein
MKLFIDDERFPMYPVDKIARSSHTQSGCASRRRGQDHRIKGGRKPSLTP